jgi:putative ABC transport system permease protein
MHSLLASLRYSVRLLLKSPGFAITAILVLGFGIGANTAIFSLINAVVLKPLPYSHPERLVKVVLPYQNSAADAFDYPDYLDVAAAQTSFDSTALLHGDFLDLTGSGETQRLCINFVSPSLFTLTGRPAILGRTFNAQEDIPHGPLLAVISERFWRNHFNADPNVIGKSLTLSEQSFEIIGVVPAQIDLWGPPPTDVYLTANSIILFSYPILQRTYHIFGCVGRLKEGVTIAKAQAELAVIQNGLISRYPETDKGYGIRVKPLLDDVVGGYSGTVWLLGAAVAVLLLIAATNVATLLFVRGLERRRELAIRVAIGATRSRLIAQLLLETGVLSLLGGIAGLGLALGSIEIIKKLSPAEVYRFQEVRIDPTTLVFVVGIIVLVAFISGVVPALSFSRPKLGSGDPNAQIAAVRKAVQSIDPDVPVPNMKTFDDVIAQKLVTRKLASTLVSLFSGAALCLSATGLYGVLTYSVSQRRREIGVRIALGAEWFKILQLVTQQGFKLIGIGLVAGTVVALVWRVLSRVCFME